MFNPATGVAPENETKSPVIPPCATAVTMTVLEPLVVVKGFDNVVVLRIGVMSWNVPPLST